MFGAPVSLQSRKLAKTLKQHLAFLVEGDRALMAMPLSKARELFLLNLLQHQRDDLVEALPFLEKTQQDYVITLLCLRPH